MRCLFVVLAAVTVCAANAVPAGFQEGIHGVRLEDRVYPRFIEFPDGEGNMHLVDLEAESDLNVLDDARNPAYNRYLLYTRRNPIHAQELVTNNAASVHNSNFNSNHPTAVIVHGWRTNESTNLNPAIRHAHLNKVESNVIVLDWGRTALADYVTAVNGVPAVGRGLGQFLIFLSSVTGARFDQMHLVGFSLGAHVVGNAGRELGGRAARVTGLDPAGPLWHQNSNRLSSNDGVYVEAIHTDGGDLGILYPSGDADFYPNGGMRQHGCFSNVCNQNRAWELFASSVTHNNIVGKQCDDLLQAIQGNCSGNSHPMGNHYLNKSGTGIYGLITRTSFPFY